MHVYMYVCIYVICIYVCACMHVYNMYLCICTYVCMHVCTYACIYAQGVQKKTDTIIFCYHSRNKHLTFQNGMYLYSQRHDKNDCRCHLHPYRFHAHPISFVWSSRTALGRCSSNALCSQFASLHAYLRRKAVQPHRFLTSSPSRLSSSGSNPLNFATHLLILADIGAMCSFRWSHPSFLMRRLRIWTRHFV